MHEAALCTAGTPAWDDPCGRSHGGSSHSAQDGVGKHAVGVASLISGRLPPAGDERQTCGALEVLWGPGGGALGPPVSASACESACEAARCSVPSALVSCKHSRLSPALALKTKHHKAAPADQLAEHVTDKKTICHGFKAQRSQVHKYSI